MTSFDHAIRLDPTFTRAAQARADLLNRPGVVPTPTPAPGTDFGVATRRESANRAARARPRERAPRFLQSLVVRDSGFGRAFLVRAARGLAGSCRVCETHHPLSRRKDGVFHTPYKTSSVIH